MLLKSGRAPADSLKRRFDAYGLRWGLKMPWSEGVVTDQALAEEILQWAQFLH
jgi:hypothetical protein